MTEAEFRAELTHAQLMRNEADDLFVACYWLGFEWGVCRRFHGANFGAVAQHKWRTLIVDHPNGFAKAVGMGYRDGLAGKMSP